MTAELKRTVEILSSLEGYFESLAPYLQQTDRSKYDRLEKYIEKCIEYKTSFEKMSRSKKADEQYFQMLHDFTHLNIILQKIYKMLDIKIPVGEDISKTRAYRLTDVFNKITSIYRIYIRDLQNDIQNYVDEVDREITETDPLVLQKYWQTWPGSIDLYTKKIQQRLDISTREKNVNLTSSILEIIESDKAFILEENSHIDPFLSFNCVPFRACPVPMSWSDIVKNIPELASKSVKELSKQYGIVHLTRVTPRDYTHNLPTGVSAETGIRPEDIHINLIPHDSNKRTFEYSIHVSTGTHSGYIIVEEISDDKFRILVPRRHGSSPVIPRDNITIIKIREKRFGRPESYHKWIEESLIQNISSRVANLAKNEIARNRDVSLGIVRIVEGIVSEVKRQKSNKTMLDKFEDEKIDKTFCDLLLAELKDVYLLDILLYWIEDLKKTFRKELETEIGKMDPETLASKTFGENDEYELRETIHRVVTHILKKRQNIFQDLYNKQHKISVIKMNT